MVIKREEEISSKPIDKAKNTEIKWLISRKDGAKNFELRKIIIKPKGTIPKHYHPNIEHEQYVLKGKYKIGLNDKVYEVKEGDSIFIPPKTIHWYLNDSDEDVEFLCIIPKKKGYDTVYLEKL